MCSLAPISELDCPLFQGPIATSFPLSSSQVTPFWISTLFSLFIAYLSIPRIPSRTRQVRPFLTLLPAIFAFQSLQMIDKEFDRQQESFYVNLLPS